MPWLNNSDDFAPGKELYSSDRKFELCDYTASHSQLLLRSPGLDGRTRIDILFKPVVMTKTCGYYSGLKVRCATVAEQGRIRDETPENRYRRDDQFFILETGGGFDYIVAMAVGWHEDNDYGDVSYFADPSGIDGPSPKWAQTALWGTHGGLGVPMATIDEFAEAARYRYIYVVTGQSGAYGAFLVKADAERRHRELSSGYPDDTYKISATPIAF